MTSIYFLNLVEQKRNSIVKIFIFINLSQTSKSHFSYSLPISFIEHNCLVLIYKFIYSLATILAVLRTSVYVQIKIVVPSLRPLGSIPLGYTGVTSSIWSKSLNFFLKKGTQTQLCCKHLDSR